MTDLKNGLGQFVFPPSRRKWKSIESFKIRYEIDGKPNELPSMTIYPPSISIPTIIKSVKVSGKAKIVGNGKGEISVESEPVGTPFEVIDFLLTKKTDGAVSSESFKANGLDIAKFANNGKIDFPFESKLNLDEANSSYSGKVTVKVIGTNEILTSESTNLVFIDAIPLVVLDRLPNYAIAINNNDQFEDNVNATGTGDLQIKFATKEYKDGINVSRSNKGSMYKFMLSGLSDLPDSSFSFFHYTNKETEISGPHLIIKKAPSLSNFKFNGIEKNQLLMNFDLPIYVKEELILIGIKDKAGKALIVGGSIVKRNPLNKTNFDVNLPSELTDLVKKDTIRDVTFDIYYNQKSIYSLGIKLFNQEILNAQIAKLISATAEKPNKRNKDEIAEIINGVVKIGTAVGNSVKNEDVATAIDGLKNGDKDKVKSTMADVGKWAVIVGKVVLDVIL